MVGFPTGTVTFLFTDIEGSTKLARANPVTWESARARHHEILRGAIECYQGYVFQIIGDAFCAAFHTTGDALKAAVKAQQDLQHELWGEVTIHVRMGVHTGEAEVQGTEYRGYLTMSLVQRLMSAAHGGQILLSDATERLLREELSNDVGIRDMGEHKFKDVPYHVRVFQVVVSDLPQDFPPLHTLDAHPNNLPAQLTSFVGREKELEDVKKLLQNAHMLTLIGPGGTGKTRLSIEAANEMMTQYPDGVWMVELAPILDPELVPRTTAIAIGLRDEPQRPVIDMLCDYLREKKILLILDNCEHLVDACAKMADRILHASLNSRILASSREALGIGGEVTYRVPSLRIPDVNHLPSIESLNQYEAVKLFIDRAMSAVPTFTVTNDNAPAVAQICYRLDGIPLAIELAAAKIRVLPAEQIAKRLDDRFKLLTGGSRTALERHQTLRAAIDWSYNLLPSNEQILFRRLSIFVGGWTLEAAESVCADTSLKSADVMELLEHLINKSLVLLDDKRYHMLETIRQYANEKLVEAGESDAVRDKHLAYFLNLAETAEPHVIRTEQIEWLPLLDADYENLRLAFEWSLIQETAESSLNLCKALCWFWVIRCYWLEGLNWSKRALAKPSQNESRNEKTARARTLNTRTQLEWQLGNFDQLSLAQETFTLASEVSDKREIAIARFYLSIPMGNVENLEQSRALAYQSFAEFQELNEAFWQAFSFQYLGTVSEREARLNLPDASATCLEFARKAGERSITADALSQYAGRLLRFNRVDEARERLEEADRLYKEIGSSMSINPLYYAEIAWLEGDTKNAESLYKELYERFSLLGEKPFRTNCICGLAVLEMEKGNLNQAQTYFDQALELSHQMQSKAYDARLLFHMADLFYLQGKLEEFKKNIREGISLAHHLNEFVKANALMTIIGSLYSQKPESAAKILGVVDHHERESRDPLFPLDKHYWARTEAQAREFLGNEAFESLFIEGQKMSLDEALDLASKAVEEM